MNGNSGFTLAETLVAASLTLLLCASVSGVFISYTKSRVLGQKAADESLLLLETDRLIRARAASVCLPYWENPLPQAVLWGEELLREEPPVGVVYANVKILSDANSRVRGASVSYTVYGTAYETVCLFSSIGVALE